MTLNAIIGAVASIQGENKNPRERFDWEIIAPEETMEEFEKLSKAKKAKFVALLPEGAKLSRDFDEDEKTEERLEEFHNGLRDLFQEFL